MLVRSNFDGVVLRSTKGTQIILKKGEAKPLNKNELLIFKDSIKRNESAKLIRVELEQVEAIKADAEIKAKDVPVKTAKKEVAAKVEEKVEKK